MKLTFKQFRETIENNLSLYAEETANSSIEQFKDNWCSGSDDLDVAVKNYLKGDMDLTPCQWFNPSLSFEIGEDYIDLQPNFKDWAETMETVMNMIEEEHMELYESNGAFHDGGDDFDYGGTYYDDLCFVLSHIG